MTMLPESKLYIDGRVCPATGGRTYDVIGPWTGAPVAKAADATAEDVEAAIAAARRAFDQTDWSTDHKRRFELVSRLGELAKARRDRLVNLARVEGGSPLGAVQSWHVEGALAGLDTLLSIFPQIRWREDRGVAELYGRASERMIVREAVGVVGAITPWNAPLFVNVAKVVSALLAGCTVVLKPAPNTPGQGAIMGELAAEAGFPPGVFNVVTSADPAMAGEMLTSDRRIDLITFTGSTAVGKRIMEKGAATLKRVFLELGGKSANIILDDAPNFAATVGRSMVTYHAGQGCAYTTRLLVPKSRYAEAVASLEQAYAAVGDDWGGFDNPSHIMGPVISKRQLERVMSYIDIGRKEGARLLAGGRTRPDKGGGFFVEPTCFVDVTNDMTIAREEIFGPVLVVIAFDDDDDAVRIANDSDYGLAGAVISADRERALRVAQRIRSGAISVNGGAAIAPDLPFGGYKHSGVGREWGLEGIEEYLETKVIAIGVA
jgi:aldehyde dehydrogenase (NAD+)